MMKCKQCGAPVIGIAQYCAGSETCDECQYKNIKKEKDLRKRK